MAKEKISEDFEKDELLPSFQLARLMDRVNTLESIWSEKPRALERSDESAEEYRNLLKNAADAIDAVIGFNKQEKEKINRLE